MMMIGQVPRSVYEEGCIAAHALDLLGDRWALLVIRELMLGAKRFQAIRAGLPGVSASVLTQRLEGLEAGGVLRRVALPDPAGVQAYELTDQGLGVWPVLAALCAVGARLPGHDPTRFISPTALMLSMRVTAEAGRAGAETIRAGFDMGRESFAGRVARGGWRVVRGAPEGDLRFEGTANALAAAVYGPRPLAELVAAGAIGFSGDPALGQRFVDRFSLRVRPPDPAWSTGG